MGKDSTKHLVGQPVFRQIINMLPKEYGGIDFVGLNFTFNLFFVIFAIEVTHRIFKSIAAVSRVRNAFLATCFKMLQIVHPYLHFQMQTAKPFQGALPSDQPKIRLMQTMP
ncbi:MAG: hypothetical protein LBL81_00760 [Tannerella sp.]|nr:hypothetical protein [Tannerella sp.]